MRHDQVVAVAAAIRESAWELALACVEEGLRDDGVPSLARLGRLGQLGDVPTFIDELGRELARARPRRLRRGGALAALARDHAREREALGFSPREIVTELLLMRRVVWRFVSRRVADMPARELLVIERRLNHAVDELIAEAVVGYFDRATSDLARRARNDPLTGLLNHQALTHELEVELERARRYAQGVSLVFFDLDDFKRVNDTFGHPRGDRVLRAVGRILKESLRASDLAGRMGGDEFAALLVQSDAETAGFFLARLLDRFGEETRSGVLPPGFSVSPGFAHFPSDASTANELFSLADRRLYEIKRSR